jgi:NAD(P)H-hydrate epimerase
LQHHYGGVAVLKGAGTLICGEQQPLLLCPLGNPGMASGGMGDVLSGVLGGLLAQGLSLLDSAQLGVWLHSRSGDLAAEKAGKRGLLATDLLSWLRTIETGSNLQD